MIDLICLDNADSWNSASMSLYGPTFGLLLISVEKTGLDIIPSLKL